MDAWGVVINSRLKLGIASLGDEAMDLSALFMIYFTVADPSLVPLRLRSPSHPPVWGTVCSATHWVRTRARHDFGRLRRRSSIIAHAVARYLRDLPLNMW